MASVVKLRTQTETSFVAEIVKSLATLVNKINMPDQRHNTGRLLAQAYFWHVVLKYAEKQKEQIWDTMRAEGIVPEKASFTEPGDRVLAESPHMVCTVRVSVPVKRFDPQELATLFKKSKYKVPELITRELVEDAKVPSKPAVMFEILERSV